MPNEFSIQLSGFRVIDSSTMMLVDKIISNHVKRIGNLSKKPEYLHVTLKEIHKREKGEKYEIHAKLRDNGKIYVAQAIDRNLLTAVDEVLKKLGNELD